MKKLKWFCGITTLLLLLLWHYGEVTGCPNVDTYQKCYGYFE
jgi:hypothetical protein